MQSITVQKIWPLEGKANGGFKATDGKTYKCDAATHGRLQEGMTFESNVKPSEWQGKTFYWLPKDFKPDNNTVGAIIPQPNGHAPAPPRQAAPAYAGKDEELITRLAILKSLIESGALLQGMGMDDLVAMAWETAPKLKVWK